MSNTVTKILLCFPNTCNSPLSSTVTFLLLYRKFICEDMYVGLHTAALTESEVISMLHVSWSMSLLAQYNNIHHFPVMCSHLFKFYVFQSNILLYQPPLWCWTAVNYILESKPLYWQLFLIKTDLWIASVYLYITACAWPQCCRLV